MKTSKLIEIIVSGIPYPNQIRDLEINENSVLFTWRSQRFRVSTDMLAETVGDGVLIRDDASILLGALLMHEYYKA